MTFRNGLWSFLRTISLIAFATAAHANQTYVGVFFDVPSINAGGTAAFDMQLRENDGTAFSGGAITVTYPAGLVNDGQYGDPLMTENCTAHGAVITRTAGTNQLIVTNVSLGAFQFCDIYVRITGSNFGSYTITIPPGSFSGTSPVTTNSATTSATLGVVGPVLVTNNVDSGAGSLRDAMNTVNANCGSATGVSFNIPGAGPHVIKPATQLPAVTCSATIDGYTQPGSAANTLVPPAGNNASIQVDLDGSSCSGCDGLQLLGSGIQVSGLAIHSFTGHGIVSAPGSSNNYILGNYIGTDAGGMNAHGNGGDGVHVASGWAVIGSGGPNLISSNGGAGIGAAGGSIQAETNQVGGKRDGSAGNGNGNGGIFLNGANYTRNTIDANQVMSNTGPGIVSLATFADVVVYSNLSFGNSGIGFDIGNDGPNANDEATPPYDTDGVLNYPVVTSVVHSGGNTIVSGYVKSIANKNGNYYLYHNNSASPVNEGQSLIGGTAFTTDAGGLATFSQTIPGSWDNVSAQAVMDTCSDACYHSSEYSPKTAVSNPLVVTNTNDSGNGSLRNAINFVNANCAAQAIAFNIPGGGFHRIVPTTPLPAITCAGVAIDGYSQPGTAANSHPQWSNAVLSIEIYGALVSTGNGLDIAAANVSVSGLSIYGFNGGAGIYISATTGTPGINVWGNFIGLDSLGNAGGNGTGIDVSGGAAITIGGPSTTVHAQRNVISSSSFNGVALRSGNGTLVQDNLIGTNTGGALGAANGTGIYVSATSSWIVYNLISANTNGNAVGISLLGANGTLIAGNLIGTNATGAFSLGNPWGIKVDASSNTVIGIPGTPNVISDSVINGITVTGSPGTLIQGNKIGTDASGTLPMHNGDGIYVDSSPGTLIGGLGAGQGNLIADNSRHGIVVFSGNAEVSGNSIYGNGQLGINLRTDADTTVPPNDSCDADGGGNGLANFPVLAAANVNGALMTVTGSHNSTANTTFRIEVFSSPVAENPANRSGQTYLGSFTATTDGACNATFSGSVNAATSGYLITATSTDPSGNTSSFSNAVTASVSSPAVSLSPPGTIDFGAQLSGVTSAPQTITLTNTGTATLNIASAVAASPFAVSGTTCGATLAASASCTYAVTFNPTAPGSFTANFTLSSDAPATPTATVPLIGVAMLPPTFALSTGTTLTPNQVTTISIRVGNPSANPLAYANFNVLLTYPAGYANDNPNGTYPQGGCGDPSFAGGSAGGNTIGAASGGSAAPGVTCSRAAAQIFAPSTTGTYTFTIPTGGFTISSPFVYTNPSPITVTATVSAKPAPAISLSTPAIAFGPQAVFSTSGPSVLTITNTGNAALNISSIFTSGDFAETNTCSVAIAPNGTCTVSVTFTPDVAGSISGSLNIVSDDPASPAIVPLSGTGVALAPAVSLTPPSLTFASRTLSTTSPAQTITLANTGNGPLTITAIAVSGDFAFTSACSTTVAAGASCTIDVTFTPLVAGPRTGNITITDNATGSPHTVPLSGTGVAGATATATISPGALDYPAQQVGSTSAQQILTVTNTGAAPLNVTGVSVTGEFAIVVPTGAGPPQCPATVLPAGACRIALVFKPTGPNLRQGVLTIVSNGGTITVTVVGTGLIAQPPQLTMASSLDFGTQPVGVTSTGHAIAMHNQSTTVATLTELTASGDFNVSDTCATIAAGATCSPLVTFQPSAVGPRAGTLTVRTLRDANPYFVNLTGVGTENLLPLLEVSAEFVGYGNAFIGEPVVKEVTLKNVGRQALQVSGITFTGDYFGDGACIGSIAPNASCTVRVTFNAGIPGGRSGAMSIISNAPDSPHDVGLSGTGCFLPTPSHTRFGTLLCGS